MSDQSSGPKSPGGLSPPAPAASAASRVAAATPPGKASIGDIAARRIAGKLTQQRGPGKSSEAGQAEGIAARLSSASSNVTVRQVPSALANSQAARRAAIGAAAQPVMSSAQHSAPQSVVRPSHLLAQKIAAAQSGAASAAVAAIAPQAAAPAAVGAAAGAAAYSPRLDNSAAASAKEQAAAPPSPEARSMGGAAEPSQPQSAPGAQSAGARPAADRPATGIGALLKLEADMRRARSLSELAYFIANEPRSIVRAQQIVVFERKAEARMGVCAVSSISRIDRSSPLVMWFEQIVATLDKDHGLKVPREFEAGAFSTAFNDVRDGYPLRNLVWIPLLDFDGAPIAGMLLARSVPWTEADITVGNHLAGSFAHSWMALDKRRSALRLPGRINRRKAGFIGLGLALLSLLPVSMSALAPVEVAPRDSFVVTTGVEGVVDQVLVEPNAPVKKGQVLIQLADTVLKNKYEIASREVLVAETKYKKAAQLAFVDMRGRHEMALAKAELELRTAERDYARDLLFRATVKAERDGIAFFGDKKDLVGRPVAVGEKLMEIADAAASEFHVDLGVADAIVLHDQARVKVFLDSDPLHPIEAKLVRADYQARAHDGQNLAFRIVAEEAGAKPKTLRLGVRGTAQVYSDRVPLVYYILRRPIAAARQWIGL